MTTFQWAPISIGVEGKGFRVTRPLGLGQKRLTRGEEGQKLYKFAWRHLWMVPTEGRDILVLIILNGFLPLLQFLQYWETHLQTYILDSLRFWQKLDFGFQIQWRNPHPILGLTNNPENLKWDKNEMKRDGITPQRFCMSWWWFPILVNSFN